MRGRLAGPPKPPAIRGQKRTSLAAIRAVQSFQRDRAVGDQDPDVAALLHKHQIIRTVDLADQPQIDTVAAGVKIGDDIVAKAQHDLQLAVQGEWLVESQ